MRHSQQHSHSSNPPEWRGRLMWMVKMRMLVILLKQKEIVGSCHRDDVLLRMPGRVQDLLVEVQTVHGDLVLLPLAPGAHLQHTVKLIDIYKKSRTHLAWFEHCLWFSNFSRCFQCHFLPRIAIKHSKNIILRYVHLRKNKNCIGIS